jgi:hypothetical protein
MSFDPLTATGLLVYSDPKSNEGPSSLGTSAMFRRPTFALTAAHCVRDIPKPRRIRIEYPRLGYFVRVSDIQIHPQADLAVIVSPEEELHPKLPPMDPFRLTAGNWGLGKEFAAYGYPTEGPSPTSTSDVPTPRLFLGHYQRFFQYSDVRYNYVAGELSIPAPAGLSGGPLFNPGGPMVLTGIVAGNVEAYSTLSWREEVREGGVERIEMHHRVIEYGIAVMLSSVQDWLDEVMPVDTER